MGLPACQDPPPAEPLDSAADTETPPLEPAERLGLTCQGPKWPYKRLLYSKTTQKGSCNEAKRGGSLVKSLGWNRHWRFM